jgi:hypothetical protein
MKRAKEFRTVSKVTGTIVLQQELVYGKCCPSDDVGCRKKTTRNTAQARNQDVLSNVIISPPTI